MQFFLLQSIWDNVQIVLLVIYIIFIYGWLKQQIGSSIVSLLVSLMFIWLVFLQEPLFIWLPLLLFIFSFFFRGLFEKIPVGDRKPDYLRD